MKSQRRINLIPLTNLLVRLLKSIINSLLDNSNVEEGTQTTKLTTHDTSQTQANAKTGTHPIEHT